MLISEYLALRNQISVTTGNSVGAVTPAAQKEQAQEGDFAAALKSALEEKRGVEFSKHAIQRLEERSINITVSATLAECRRTWCHVLARSITLGKRHT